TLTPGLRQMVVERYGVPADRVCVIPSGTDPDHFAPDDVARCRREIGLDPARPTVGFVGLFYRHQGVGTLLGALARLHQWRPVVASDRLSVRSLADDSGALTLVPPDDAGALAQALGDLLERPERRAELGRRGRDHVCRHHSWRRLAGALESSVRSSSEVSAR